MVLALLLAAAPASARAQARGAGEISAGVVIGEPIGGTLKLWWNDQRAIDFGAGFSSGDAAFWADVLHHDWRLLPQPREGRLGAYLGAGPQLRAGDDARFGIRTIAGLSYRVSGRPLELFAEAGPHFRLTQGGAVDAVGGLGLRVSLGTR